MKSHMLLTLPGEDRPVRITLDRKAETLTVRYHRRRKVYVMPLSRLVELMVQDTQALEEAAEVSEDGFVTAPRARRPPWAKKEKTC